MARRRLERLERIRGRRKRWYVLAAVLGVLALGGVAFGVTAFVRSIDGADAQTPPEAAALQTMALETSESVLTTRSPDVLIEVPPVVGMQVDEAELMLGAVGFAVHRVPTPPGEEASGTVLSQTPPPGERVTPDTLIELVYADPAASQADVASAVSGGAFVVCIDPGHQQKANTATEPIGPGSAEKKMKVSGGATGVVSKQTEYALVLAVSLKVKDRLERAGVRVVMTRMTDAVDISNAQRAQVANEADADLFVRVHADSNTNADLRGISTLYPSGNEWVAPIEVRSLKAAELVHAEMLASTGAQDRGLVKRADLAGFNWATVPSVLVEMGFMSNPIDDRALADPAYQDKLADGIARGILKYLED